MADINEVIGRVPAPCLSAAARMLPNPEYCSHERWSVESDAGPVLGWARFTFERVTKRQGQLWSCRSIEPIEPTDVAPF